ncbi:hypothetical protein HHI36_022451 [Cryptolaemus montrouzieri]|uniref:Uncharacterized protein n=1 Tax=Cryptolaemus montrouzieri TaxID=559131 RepID=A0ABD2N089_9CUCU
MCRIFVNSKINKILNRSEQLVNDKKLVEEFNHYFSKIGQQLAERIEKTERFENYEKSTNNTPFLYPADPVEVEKTIDVLKDGKAARYDGIISEVLKKIKHEISEPISLLTNLCFEKGKKLP